MSFQTRQIDCGHVSACLMAWRLAEFVLVFVVPPALYARGIVHVILIPAIGVIALVSLLVTSLEHALYGQLIFTVGLGEFFYHGTIKLAETVLR